MQYNLLESHKELARWFVEQYRTGKLWDEFVVIFLPNGHFDITWKEMVEPTENRPSASPNALKALAEEKLIMLDIVDGTGDYYCGFLPNIFTAVDTNFGEIETDLKPRSEDVGGLGLSLPKFSQILARDFNQSELDDLLFNMGIDSAEIPGNSPSEKARETVRYAQRHGRLLELLIRAAKSRPKTDWSQLYE